MNRFAIARPNSFEEARGVLVDGGYRLPVLKAGGMDVVDHLKEGLWEPDVLVDVKRLRAVKAAGGVSRDAKGMLRVEAGTTLAEIAASKFMKADAPVVARAAGSAATPQVRNVASCAGNLLQRPRCWYYRSADFDCLKKGGDRCYAVEGENRYHAIFGGGPCHIVHPSNLAVALHVCDGTVHVLGAEKRTVTVADLYHLPERGIRDEHELAADEVVTHVTLSAAPHSGFYAVKEKQSFDWPTVMAAVALDLDGRRIASARVCAGAVAPVPWPLPKVAAALRGANVDDDAALKKACAMAADGAKPMRDNGYKAKLLPVAVVRAVRQAAGRPEEG